MTLRRRKYRIVDPTPDFKIGNSNIQPSPTLNEPFAPNSGETVSNKVVEQTCAEITTNTLQTFFEYNEDVCHTADEDLVCTIPPENEVAETTEASAHDATLQTGNDFLAQSNFLQANEIKEIVVNESNEWSIVEKDDVAKRKCVVQ